MQAVFRQVGWAQTKDALAQLLKDTDPTVRTDPTLALAKFNDTRALPHLQEALTAEDAFTRATAIRSLSTLLHDTNVIDQLLPLVQTETDPHVCNVLFQVLASHSEPRVIDALLVRLVKADPQIRRGIIFALRGIREQRIFTALEPYLQDPDPGVRGETILSLGMSGDPNIVDTLVKALHDKALCSSAVSVCLNYRDPRLGPPLLALLADPGQ